MKKIALINVFIGEFPWFFDYFIKSCLHNPTIDFYIFCDTSYSKPVPKNVNLLDLTLTQFNLLASSKLELEVSIENAYKLCDFKPAYGIIFSDYLTEYDFWGICDIDIIFGRIREFMTDDILTEYEVISVRPDFPTGYFMLFKNEQKINTLFTKSKDYEMVFSSQKHFCFDECNFKHDYVSKGYNILEILTEIESMHHILVRENNNIKVFWDFLIIEGHPGNLHWDTGQLIYLNKYEVILYHLRFFKSNIYVHKKSPEIIPENFKIHSYHIQNTSVNIFKKLWNHFKYEKIKIFFARRKRWIDRLIAFMVFNSPKLKQPSENIFSDGDVFLIMSGTYALLSYDENFQNYHVLIPSYFKKGTYYTKNKPSFSYIISKPSTSIINLKTINRVGNISKFKLQK